MSHQRGNSNIPSYEEMYRKLLDLRNLHTELVLPYPIEKILPPTAAQNVPLSEHDRLIRDFYRIMAKATQSEAPLATYLRKTS